MGSAESRQIKGKLARASERIHGMILEAQGDGPPDLSTTYEFVSDPKTCSMTWEGKSGAKLNWRKRKAGEWPVWEWFDSKGKKIACASSHSCTPPNFDWTVPQPEKKPSASKGSPKSGKKVKEKKKENPPTPAKVPKFLLADEQRMKNLMIIKEALKLADEAKLTGAVVTNSRAVEAHWEKLTTDDMVAKEALIKAIKAIEMKVKGDSMGNEEEPDEKNTEKKEHKGGRRFTPSGKSRPTTKKAPRNGTEEKLLKSLDEAILTAQRAHVVSHCSEMKSAITLRITLVTKICANALADEKKVNSLFLLAGDKHDKKVTEAAGRTSDRAMKGTASSPNNRQDSKEGKWRPVWRIEDRVEETIPLTASLDRPTQSALNQYLVRVGELPGADFDYRLLGGGRNKFPLRVQRALERWLKRKEIHCGSLISSMWDWLRSEANFQPQSERPWRALQNFLNSQRSISQHGYLSSNTIRTLQEFLIRSGEYPGKIDGLWGPRTTKAFQCLLHKRGFYAGSCDGKLLHSTLTSMRAFFSKLGFYKNYSKNCFGTSDAARLQGVLQSDEADKILDPSCKLLAMLEVALAQARDVGIGESKVVKGLLEQRKRFVTIAVKIATQKCNELTGKLTNEFRLNSPETYQKLDAKENEETKRWAVKRKYGHKPATVKALQLMLIKSGIQSLDAETDGEHWDDTWENALVKFLCKGGYYKNIFDDHFGGFKNRHYLLADNLERILALATSMQNDEKSLKAFKEAGKKMFTATFRCGLMSGFTLKPRESIVLVAVKFDVYYVLVKTQEAIRKMLRECETALAAPPQGFFTLPIWSQEMLEALLFDPTVKIKKKDGSEDKKKSKSESKEDKSDQKYKTKPKSDAKRKSRGSKNNKDDYGDAKSKEGKDVDDGEGDPLLEPEDDDFTDNIEIPIAGILPEFRRFPNAKKKKENSARKKDPRLKFLALIAKNGGNEDLNGRYKRDGDGVGPVIWRGTNGASLTYKKIKDEKGSGVWSWSDSKGRRIATSIRTNCEVPVFDGNQWEGDKGAKEPFPTLEWLYKPTGCLQMMLKLDDTIRFSKRFEAHIKEDIKRANEKRCELARALLRTCLSPNNLNQDESSAVSFAHMATIIKRVKELKLAGPEVDKAKALLPKLAKGALKLATRTLKGIEQMMKLCEDCDLGQCEEFKLAKEALGAQKLAPVDLQIQRQPSTDSLVIETMALPENVANEKRRSQLIKAGKSKLCSVCKGTGFLNDEAAVDESKSKPPEEATKESEKTESQEKKNISSEAKSKAGLIIQDSSQSLPTNGCWVCKGTGKTSEWVTSYTAPEGEGKEELNCAICWGEAQWGVSTECAHFYCSDCIKKALQAMLDTGQFPAYCPMCRAESSGKEPEAGRIEGRALTFLQRRGVISLDLQFRIMKQQKESKGVEYFRCPAECGNFLRDQDPLYMYQIVEEKMNHRRVLVRRPGLCPCGALVCVVCHSKLNKEDADKHECGNGKGLAMDKKTKKALKGIGKACPCCGEFIQKNGGCNVMMCGTHAHGSILVAVRNGGCGFQFHWDSLKPYKGSYIGIKGTIVSGLVTRTEQRRAMEAVGIRIQFLDESKR